MLANFYTDNIINNYKYQIKMDKNKVLIDVLNKFNRRFNYYEMSLIYEF